MAAGLTKQQKARVAQKGLRKIAKLYGGVYARNETVLANGCRLTYAFSNASNGETFGQLKVINPVNGKEAQSFLGKVPELLAQVVAIATRVN